jgi:hypothetical protein
MAIPIDHPQTVRSKQIHKPKGRKFWQHHIEAWSQSGLAQAEYCRQNNISKSAFYGWKNKLKAEAHEAPDNAFAAVHVKPNQSNATNPTDTLDITLVNGVKVSLPVQANPSQLLPWLETLSHLP